MGDLAAELQRLQTNRILGRPERIAADGCECSRTF
jgi:hypothetical protein